MSDEMTLEPGAKVGMSDRDMDATLENEEGNAEKKSPFVCEPAAYQSVLMMLAIVTIAAAVGSLILGAVAMRCIRQRFPS